MEWLHCPNKPIEIISPERYLIEKKRITPNMLPVIRSVYSNKTISLASGCFDILHPGHAEFLMQAREQAEMLVVGVNSDTSVKRLKGPNRPKIPDYKRAAMIAALGMTDYVYIFDELNVSEHLELLKPDVYTVFEESMCADKPELVVAENLGINVHVVGRYGSNNSSTYIINSL